MNVQQQQEHSVDPTLLILQLLTLTSIAQLAKETESIVPQALSLKSLELIRLLIVNNVLEGITAQMHLIQQRLLLVVLELIAILELLHQQVLLLVQLVIIALLAPTVLFHARKENTVMRQVFQSQQEIVMQDTTVDTPPRLPLLQLFQQVLSVQLVITVKQVLEHLKHVLLEPIILQLERLHQLTVLIV